MLLLLNVPSEVPRSQLILAGLFVAVAPLTLLVFNQNWMFTPAGYLDPWNYVGYFREYLNPQFAPGAYKLARLPWILAGFSVFSLLPPVPAAYVLHGAFLSLTSLALFAGLYLLLNRVALAAVVATMLGFYTHAHGSGGWDYHNTAAGAFYLLAFLSFALPGTIAGRRPHLVAAGAMTALAVHANITLVNFLPVLVFVYLQTVQVRTGQFPSWREVLTRAAWCTLGGVLITVVLGLINMLAGREFMFFGLLARITARYVADSDNVSSWRMAPGWVLTARHLSLPGAVFFAGAVALVAYRRATGDSVRLARALIIQFLVMGLVWTGWQMAGQLALDWHYFAYVLIPSCFIALGGLLSLVWPDACERHWPATIVATALACLVGLVIGLRPLVGIIPTSAFSVITLVGGAIFAVGLLALLSRSAVITFAVFVLTYALGNTVVSNGGYEINDPCKVRQDVYAAIVDGAAFLGTVDPSYTQVRTWFDSNEEFNPTPGCKVNAGDVSGSLASTATVRYLTSPWPKMPGVNEVPQPALEDATKNEAILAIITNKHEHLDAWSRRLDQIQIDHQEIAQHRVPLLGDGFSIHAWRLMPKAPALSRFGAPVIAVTDQTPVQVNAYGSPKGAVVTEGENVVFKPTDERDRLDYAPFLFPPLQTDVWAEVRIELPPSATNGPTCRLIVENPDMTLGEMRCSSGKRYMKIPSGSSGLRLRIFDSTRRPFVLPRRLEVALDESTG